MVRARLVCLVVLLAGVSAEDDNTYYLEDYCSKSPEITLSATEGPQFVHLKLRREGFEAKPECKTSLLFKTNGNYNLLFTMGNIRLTDREDSGLCLRHFIQLDGLKKDSLIRLCQRGEPLRYSQPLISKKWEVDVLYHRSVNLEVQHDVDIVIASVANANETGECPSVPHPESREMVQMFKCYSDHLCVPNAYKCDKIANCEDASDELDCPGTVLPPVITSSASVNSSELAGTATGAADSKGKTHHVVIGVTGGVVIICLVGAIAFFVVRRVHGDRRNRQIVSTVEPDDNTAQLPTVKEEDERIDTTERRNGDTIV